MLTVAVRDTPSHMSVRTVLAVMEPRTLPAGMMGPAKKPANYCSGWLMGTRTCMELATTAEPSPAAPVVPAINTGLPTLMSP